MKIYTTITDRYAPLHQKVIAGTAGEAIHALDGILGHESNVSVSALHVDGGGVSDNVFAIAALLGRSFEPRIPRLSDRKLYAFEPKTRYGRLAPLFGHRLDANLILGHADEIGKVIRALADKVVTPSLILKKLSAYRQKNSLAAALREIGRIERTLFTLRWFGIPLSGNSSPQNSTRAKHETPLPALSPSIVWGAFGTVAMKIRRAGLQPSISSRPP